MILCLFCLQALNVVLVVTGVTSWNVYYSAAISLLWLTVGYLYVRGDF